MESLQAMMKMVLQDHQVLLEQLPHLFLDLQASQAWLGCLASRVMKAHKDLLDIQEVQSLAQQALSVYLATREQWATWVQLARLAHEDCKDLVGMVHQTPR
jgi:hypothetical protein